MTHLIAHILRTLERVTRPPRMGHDVDVVHDGADQLAEREAEEEVSEPVSPASPAERLAAMASRTLDRLAEIGAPIPETSPAAAHPDLVAEIRDAVSDNYDHNGVGPLWHEEGIPDLISWSDVAATLLLYFDIRPKAAQSMESGQDIGASAFNATEFFPQFRGSQK